MKKIFKCSHVMIWGQIWCNRMQAFSFLSQNSTAMANFSKRLLLLLLLYTLSALSAISAVENFKCRSPARCQALVGYVPYNKSSLSEIQSLFNVENLVSILGANNLPPDTPRNFFIEAKQVVKIPIPCLCDNNTGVSNKMPVYVVKKDDGLDFIARTVFGGLLKYPKIQEANDIVNADIIQIGQNLTIPLPCSCDDVENEKVIHYAHLVEEESTLESIALKFGTDKQTLMNLNDITDRDLKADEPIDVPLKACNSSIQSDTLDGSLLVANGTYAVTANSCVRCRCASANNWTLLCEPTGIQKPSNSKWDTCPSTQCEGSESFLIGNATSNGCTACAYAGYNNETILTKLNTLSTCSTPSNDASKMGSSWNFLLITIFILFCTM